MTPITSRLANWPLPKVALGTGAWQQPNAIQPQAIPALVEFVLSQPNPALC